MKELTVKELYTLDETIAKDIFEGVTYPWEVLPKISRFIVELGNTLSEEEYEKQGLRDRRSSEEKQRSDIARLSVEMQSWERGQ